ncbi:MAG: CPBP family intramembrane metalloprotease [Planctomycetaceae bacterium]|nr:CPBP family intramembrane metalloprotease [Planctomycetaceae bacterium]
MLVVTTLWKCLFVGIDVEFSGGWYWLGFLVGEWKLVSVFIFFGLIPMCIVKFVFRERLSDYGLRIGEVVRTVRSFCIAFPFILFFAYAAAGSGLFEEVYPFNESLRRCNSAGMVSKKVFVCHAILYAGYYFGWEFMFRGFVQHGLSPTCGIGTAILIQTIPSAMLHFGHPTGEVLGSICAGLAWGYLAYRSRSILSGLAQHTILGVVLDWKLIYG